MASAVGAVGGAAAADAEDCSARVRAEVGDAQEETINVFGVDENSGCAIHTHTQAQSSSGHITITQC